MPLDNLITVVILAEHFLGLVHQWKARVVGTDIKMEDKVELSVLGWMS